MSRLKRSDVARAVKSLERCVKLCKGLPSDSPGFARVEPLEIHLRAAIKVLTEEDENCDSLEFDYYLNACNEELKEALWLLNYLITHCEGKPRKAVLDIHKRLIKIRGLINQHFWSDV
nr:MAG TPA: UPF0302 domain protein [Caudoviricetes sp.]